MVAFEAESLLNASLCTLAVSRISSKKGPYALFLVSKGVLAGKGRLDGIGATFGGGLHGGVLEGRTLGRPKARRDGSRNL